MTLPGEWMQVFHFATLFIFFLRLQIGKSLTPGVLSNRCKARAGWFPEGCFVVSESLPGKLPSISRAKTSQSREVPSILCPSQPSSIQRQFFAWVLLHHDPDWQLWGLNSGPLCTLAPWSVELQNLYFSPLSLPCISQNPTYPLWYAAFLILVYQKKKQQNTRPYNNLLEMVMMACLG